MRRRLLVLVAPVAFVCLVLGCRRVSKRMLNDTEGRSFVASCDREGVCELSRETAQSVAPDKPKLVLHAAGRFISICDTSNGAPTDITDCRILVCKKDEECPPNHGLPHGTCVNDLCTEPSNALVQDDAILLCLAGTGLGRSSSKQADLYALARNCGTPCVIPTPCRKP
ncbi:MAG TPA: hypothetical protein PKA88_30180 [Polyangiaceae bacterium]|nr:hypothetical protein [Polyangiaceae bacterium]